MVADNARVLAVLIVRMNGRSAWNTVNDDNRLKFVLTKKIKHLPGSDVVKQNDAPGSNRIE